MNNKKWFFLILLLLLNFTAGAFDSIDDQIDRYLGVLETGDPQSKTQMLKRLQWSALSDPRLYDAIEQQLLEQMSDPGLTGRDARVLPYHIRALGYSGNAKYRATLLQVKADRQIPILTAMRKKPCAIWSNTVNGIF